MSPPDNNTHVDQVQQVLARDNIPIRTARNMLSCVCPSHGWINDGWTRIMQLSPYGVQ